MCIRDRIELHLYNMFLVKRIHWVQRWFWKRRRDIRYSMIFVWKWHDETFSNYNIVLLYIRTRRDPSNKKGKNKTAWVFVENETKKWDAPRTVSKQNPPSLLRPTERDPKKHGKRARRQNPQIYDVNSHHSTPPTKSQLGRPQHSWRLLLPRCLICAHHPKHPIPARSALARG